MSTELKPGTERKLGVVTYMPCAGDVHPAAAKAYFAEMTQELPAKKIPVMRLDPKSNSNLAHGFNEALCFALNLRSQGLCSHFAMLHADLIPDAWWLDTLWNEAERVEADFIAAVSAIKNLKGATSVAVSHGNRWNPYARLTMKEVHQLPETFNVEDIVGSQSEVNEFGLLLNTGCMLLDLRPDYWGQVGDRGELLPHFEIRSRIVFVPGTGWQAQTETEDWMLSRILNELGAKLFCTRKVVTNHVGAMAFTSGAPWGEWAEDQAGERAAERLVELQKQIHPNSYWLENLPDSYIHDEGLEQSLAKLCKEANYSVIDLGCGQGWYVKALEKAGVYVNGIDGNPHVEEQGPSFFKRDLTEPLNQFEWARDLVFCLEVGEHIPAQYSDKLLDNICNLARKQAIVSWALPGQSGHGHINCQTNEWVEEQMKKRGFARNVVVEQMLRCSVSISYFQKTLMVYDRVTPIANLDTTKISIEKSNPTLTDVIIPREAVDMITYMDLVQDTQELIPKLPHNLSGVLGVSRKGMLPATIIATSLHLPLGEVNSFPVIGYLSAGARQPLYNTPGPILIVDDGVGSGKAILESLSFLNHSKPDKQFVTAAIVVIDSACSVDYYARLISPLQMQESEFLNTVSVKYFAVDLDGVICQNPKLTYESDDDTYWNEWFANVEPLHLPRFASVHAIVTSRLEKYRHVTEAWLDKWGVKYNELVMHPANTARERDTDVTSHGIKKGYWFKNSSALIFVESEPDQAQQIAKLSNKPVFCVATKQYVNPY